MPTGNAHRARINQFHRQDARKAGAKLREEARAQLTPQQQLDVLDGILGVGVGAARERAKLDKLINEAA